VAVAVPPPPVVSPLALVMVTVGAEV